MLQREYCNEEKLYNVKSVSFTNYSLAFLLDLFHVHLNCLQDAGCVRLTLIDVQSMCQVRHLSRATNRPCYKLRSPNWAQQI
jgi:hypothetical protein